MNTFPAIKPIPVPCPGCGINTASLGRRVCTACLGRVVIRSLPQPVVRGRRVGVDGLIASPRVQ